MDTLQIKISGIYDKRTIKTLNDLGVKCFEFDSRPRSFNFIQKRVIETILKESFIGEEKVSIHFANEVDFVVKDILSVFSEFKKTTLTFSDDQEATYYDQFETPYYWHYRTSKNTKEILASKHNIGIIFDIELLEELLSKQTLNTFFMNFLSLPKTIDKELIIKMDWNSELSAQIRDIIDPSYIELSVNDKVEVCYRNVDTGKIVKNLQIISKQSC